MKKPKVWVNDDNYLCVDYGDGRDFAFNVEDLEPEDREHLANAFNKYPKPGSTPQLFTELYDHYKDSEAKPIKTRVVAGGMAAIICPQGFGVATNLEDFGSIVFVEQWNNELRVLVWSDINQEDPTHTISLEGARLENRKEK